MRSTRRTDKPAYFFHITENFWGEKKILRPRSYGRNRAAEEPKVSRICIAPTPAHCLSAIFGSLESHQVYVYRTAQEVRPHHCYGVVDSRITRERWLKEPTEFVLHNSFDSRGLMDYLLAECNWDFLSTAGDEEQKKTLPYYKFYYNAILCYQRYVA